MLSTRFDRILEVLRVEDLHERMSSFDPGCGVKGIRDTFHPCSGFDPTNPYVPNYRPNGDCSTDGHYLCFECKNLDPKSEYAFEECTCSRYPWPEDCSKCNGDRRVSRFGRRR